MLQQVSKIKVMVEIESDFGGSYIDYSNYLPQPFTYTKKLDESLDLSFLTLKNTNKEISFTPFLKARISIIQGNNTSVDYWFIANDNVEKNISTNTYNHNITLIEITKILERIVCDTRTFRQPRTRAGEIKILPSSIQIVPYNTDVYQDLTFTESDYFEPYLADNGNFNVYNCFYYNLQPIDQTGANVALTRVYKVNTDGTRTQVYESNAESERTIYTISTSQYGYGIYEVENFFTMINNPTVTITFNLNVVESLPATPDITLYDVIDSILKTCETLRTDEVASKQRIVLGNVATENQKYISTNYLQNTKAPEFSFGKMTLWEIFSAIGGKIQAIPKVEINVLNQYALYFQKLDFEQEVPQLQDCISVTETYSNEQYCDKIDTNVDNLIDTTDFEEGSVVEPFDNYYKTLRNETGTVVVQEADSFIQTQYPIERIIKVECGYLPDETLVGDITDFVYEQTEYNSLSSYNNYPPAKAFAIYYTYGERGIRGLTFRPEQAWANVFNLQLFNYYAITNIIAQKISKLPSVINTLFTGTYDLRNLQFRITYIPRITARITQYKPEIEASKFRSTITYNQNANLVSSKYYGDNLKGVVSRYGNPEKPQVFICNDIQDIANIGDMNIEDNTYRASQVNCEFYDTFFKQELQYIKNFNRFSQYVGADNYLRLFEVSERQISNRQIVYDENIIFAYDDSFIEDTYSNADDCAITSQGLLLFARSFVYDIQANQVDRVLLRTIDNNNDFITNYISLPVISQGEGNSMYFMFSFADNYSAGDKIIAREDNTAEPPVYYDAQQYTPYTDYWGNVYSIDMQIGNGSTGEEITNFGDAWDVGNSFPEYAANLSNITFSFAQNQNKSLLVLKDSAEIISIAVQEHFRTTKENGVIIGSALSSNNTLVSTKQLKFALYVLPYTLGQLVNRIDITNATRIGTFTQEDITQQIVQNHQEIHFANKTSTTNGVAWAIVNEEATTGFNDFIIGRNITINNGDTIEMPTIYTARQYKQGV